MQLRLHGSTGSQPRFIEPGHVQTTTSFPTKDKSTGTVANPPQKIRPVPACKLRRLCRSEDADTSHDSFNFILFFGSEFNFGFMKQMALGVFVARAGACFVNHKLPR
ncbi:hypothetical protein VTL71DRAFT_7353, partial [Oculimacula yallundae]